MELVFSFYIFYWYQGGEKTHFFHFPFTAWNTLLPQFLMWDWSRVSAGKCFHNRFHFFSPTPRSRPCLFPLPTVTLQHCSLHSSGKIVFTLSNPAALPVTGEGWVRDQSNLSPLFLHTVRLYLLWVPVARHSATHQLHTAGFFRFVGPGPQRLCRYWNQIISLTGFKGRKVRLLKSKNKRLLFKQ